MRSLPVAGRRQVAAAHGGWHLLLADPRGNEAASPAAPPCSPDKSLAQQLAARQGNRLHPTDALGRRERREIELAAKLPDVPLRGILAPH